MRKPLTDARAELLLGAGASLVLITIAGMAVFVFAKAWPSFAHNGLGWFGAPHGATVDEQMTNIFNSPADPKDYVYELGAWPLIWGTILTTAGAVVIGLRPDRCRRGTPSSQAETPARLVCADRRQRALPAMFSSRQLSRSTTRLSPKSCWQVPE